MRRILIVEDDADLALLLSELLAGSGAETCVAHSLDEVQAQEHEALACDLAILDVNLGAYEPTGVDVSRWLRDQGFEGPVVFLTGHARSHPMVAEAASVPGSRVLAKPIAAEDLSLLAEGAP
jgi:CheY-like chemotaxis protein